MGDPELGEAALEDGGEDDATGGGDAGGDGDVRDCPDDDEDIDGQCRPEGANRAGAGSLTARPTCGALTSAPGMPKCSAKGLFGNKPPKKVKQAAATKQQEAAKTAAI